MRVANEPLNSLRPEFVKVRVVAVTLLCPSSSITPPEATLNPPKLRSKTLRALLLSLIHFLSFHIDCSVTTPPTVKEFTSESSSLTPFRALSYIVAISELIVRLPFIFTFPEPQKFSLVWYQLLVVRLSLTTKSPFTSNSPPLFTVILFIG